MKSGTFNFQNPEIQQKASQRARLAPRPKTYNSKHKRVQEVQKELIREELLKSGFVEQLGAVMPRINAALIASASKPNSSGAADRRTVYTALKIIGREKESEPQQSIGQILAEIVARPRQI